MNQHTLIHKEKSVRIVTSTFGTLAGLRGATSIVFKRFFNGEISLENLFHNSQMAESLEENK